MISVIIPTFNRHESIRKAIHSVLKQTYQDVECLVVDDGSTDDTEAIVKTIKDSRVNYIRYEKNQGACYARNVGIEQALGEYIAFQDSDDDWSDAKLEKQLQYLLDSGADLVFCQLESKYNNKTAYYPSNKYKEGKVSYQQAMCSFMSSTQTFLGKAECIRAIKFDEEMLRFQDWDFLIRFTHDYNVYYQKQPFAIQQIGMDSISNNPKKGYVAVCRMIDKYAEEMDKKSLSNLYMLKGTFLTQLELKGAESDFKEALKLNPVSKKTYIKWILCRMGLLNRWYGR